MAKIPARGCRGSAGWSLLDARRGGECRFGGLLGIRGAFVSVLVVCFQMLLHVVCPGEFLLAALVGAVYTLLGSVDFGVS